MNYIFITCLSILSLVSCVSNKEYVKGLEENNEIKKIIEKNDFLTQEVRNIKFKVKNIVFSLKMCEIKLRRQDRKLVECINLRGCE